MRSTSPFTSARIRRFLAVAAVTFVAGCSSPEEKAQSYYESGAQYLQAGDHTRAMLEFRNAVKLDEKLTPAWFAMAKIEEESQNWQAVARALQRVVELDASHVEARIKLARLQLAGGDIQKSLALVNAANEIKPEDSDIHALRAAVLLRLNDRDGARTDAERALSLDRDNPDAYAVLAADAMLDKNSAAALRFIERGLKGDAQNIGLLLFKLKLHEQDADFQNAETVMRQLIVASPDNKNIRRALVAFLLDHKRPADAETEMRALVAANPADSAVALEFVQFAGTQKGPDAARHELARLIEANPRTADYKLAMAKLDFSQSQPEAAIERLNAIISVGEPSEDVERARLLLAEMLLEDDKFERAATFIADVLSVDQKNADALALRANLRLQAGNYEGATADLRAALDQEPQSVRLLQLMAKVFDRQGVTDLANDNYVQAVRAANYAPAVTLEYASFLSKRGDLARADAILSESLSRVPNNTDVLSALGRVRLARQDWVGAEGVAELLGKSGDRSGISDHILGVALLGQNKFDRSIETLKSAYSETPEAVRPLYSLIAAYIRAGNADEAEAFLDSVLAANPDNADAHVLLGLLRGMKNEPEQAVAAYNTAIERQPKNPVGYRALAGHLVAAGKPDEAEAVLLSGRKQVPDDLGLNLLLAGLLEKKSDPEGALAIYEALLADRPDALILINNVASLLADHKTDEASLERAYRLALRLRDLDVAQFKDTIGWVHYRRGEHEAAVDYLESAVEGLPAGAVVRYHLAKAYAALKRNDDARAQFTKAAELAGEDEALSKSIEESLSEVGKSQALN